MDFSELYVAVSKQDERRVNQLVDAIIPVLVSYLCATMRAERADAKDCVQMALLHTIGKIRDDKIREPSRLYYYLLSACRNNYLRMSRNTIIELSDNMEVYHAVEPAAQVDRLLDKERQTLLRECLQKLSEEYRQFINYFLRFPEAEAKDIAAKFNLSTNNVWTRKHRIIKWLHNCYKKKSDRGL